MTPGRYDTTGNSEAEFEPGSDGMVLKNKLGISDASEMDDVELDLLRQLYDEIPESMEVDQTLTSADICEWHRRWLGNVYPWAGKSRTVNMGKGDFQFAAAGQIDRLMAVLDRDFLSRYTPCIGMSDEQLTEAIAVVHIELILIHPFREGNGRISRLLANVMAMQAGKPELDFSLWDEQKERYFSAIRAGLDNYEPMKELVRQVLRDASRNADD
ncbi:Fic/DOC family protein [Sedimenticola selenatireducens]|uniref:Fic/DOC family protein n=1 Tax=Sedimenticola selenatireducens TaxID=191960 RepID=UPI00049122E4|nr:Fic family protein [Sedimenticola selenatireducens]